MVPFPSSDFAALLPVAILVAGALVLLMTEVFLTSGKRGYQAGLTVVTAALAALAAVMVPPAGSVFGGMAHVDAFSVFVTVTVCGGLALSALVGAPWLHARNAERGEYYALALFATCGMSLLASAADFLVAFIAIEVMSLATYALAAWMRRGRRPAEAAFKYFILGAFSSALLLYGTALVFGATSSTLFADVPRGSGGLLVVGLGLVGTGLAFKIAAVPFHFWTPDVYEGAPTPVTAFMAAGVKTAAFAVLTRLFVVVWGSSGLDAPRFGAVVSALAILTMIFGNLLALPQRSVKRMLAYSSVGHAGYLLVGVVAAGAAGGGARESGLSSVLFYLAAYTATVIGAFAVVGAVERKEAAGVESRDPWDLSRLSGLAKRRPWLAFVMAVFMLSLAGVPPTAGFIAKLLVFKAAVQAQAYGLAIVGMLTSGLGAYYYLRVVVFMYMRQPDAAADEPLLSPMLSVALGVAALAVVVLGVGPEPVAALARAASTFAP